MIARRRESGSETPSVDPHDRQMEGRAGAPLKCSGSLWCKGQWDRRGRF